MHGSTRFVLAATVCAIGITTVLGSLSGVTATAAPPLSDVIQRVDPEEYQVDILLHLVAYQHEYQAEVQFEMQLKNTPVVWPLVLDGGFHTVDETRIIPTFALEDRVVDPKFKLIETKSLETMLARYMIEEFSGKQIDMQMRQFVTSYSAKLNEKAAFNIQWPDTWEKGIESALQPQMYIESSDPVIGQIVERWTGKSSDWKKTVAPHLMGKLCAQFVVENFQISGRNFVNNKNGLFAGLEMQGAKKSAEQMRGSLHDANCMFVALCRHMGLPARPVIGVDTGEKNELISWAEYYLPTAGWVSVDLRELKSSPGSMHQTNRPWPGLGTNDELNELVPLAHHFHPPAYVMGAGRQGKPMIWGWAPQPKRVPTDQELRIDVMKAPKRGGQPYRGRQPRRGRGG